MGPRGMSRIRDASRGMCEERAAVKREGGGRAALMHDIPSGPIGRLCDFLFFIFYFNFLIFFELRLFI